MQNDAVGDILEQSSGERPELHAAGLEVVIRIMSLSRAFRQQAARALESLGLELFEYDVLAALRRQGTPFLSPASSIANETGLSLGATTNRIHRLVSRGLVRRRQHAKDRRGVNVSLTAKGRRLIERAIRLRLDAADRGLAGLGPGERQQLESLLRRLMLGSPGGLPRN